MRITIVLMISILAAFSIGLAQTTLENIAISKYGDTILADIITSEKCQYDHFIPDSEPVRIVVDLKNTLNNWSKKSYLQLPTATISGVRTSQYQSKPELITRVVFDIDHPTKYTVDNLPNGVRIKIPAVSGERNFATWQARASVTLAQNDEDKELPSAAENLNPTSNEPVAIKKPAENKPEAKSTAIAEKPKEKPIEKTEKTASKAVEKTAVDTAATRSESPAQSKWGESAPPKKDDRKTEAAASPPQPRETPMMGLPIDVIHERKIASYEPKIDRDPFKSLVGQGSAKAGAGKLPAVENLTLVGILEEDEASQALFEDAEGNGYILKPNDPVRNGYLLAIHSDKAVFQITEYGWTRTVALNLKLPELK